MATKPLTTEAIALTEKKMDMSLDDIIKLSKTNAGNSKKQRVSNKSRRPSNGKQERSMKIWQYMDSRSTLRQGVLAQRRSNFQGNSFPLASEAARKVAVAPFRNGGFNRNRAVNWNRPRAAGMQRQQRGNILTGGKVVKQQLQHRHPSQRGELQPSQKPKTLDSLFANMKEQRMRTFPQSNNGGAVRSAGNQPRQPWLRGRFGNYRN